MLPADMHLFSRALSKKLANAVRDAPTDVVVEPQSKPTVPDTCTFNPKTRTLRIRVQPSRLRPPLDLAKKIGKKAFLLCLDVSGSMGGHASEMIRIVQQVEDELLKLQSLVHIRLLFFSGHLLDHTPLGELGSVCTKNGWMGGTQFKPPLDACLDEVQRHPDVEHTVLFMTDGVSEPGWDGVAKALHDHTNVKVLSVGFGSNVNESSLRLIAGGRTENMHQFKGADASSQLHGLLQSVVGCGIVIPTFAGRIVVGDTTVSTLYYPYSTDADETGIHACVPLPADCSPGRTIQHAVGDLVDDAELQVVVCDTPDRDTHIMALRHALDAMRQSTSADNVKQLRTLAIDLQHWEANDLRIREVRTWVEKLAQTASSHPTLSECQGMIDRIQRFVHALLTGAMVSARSIKMVKKATEKLDAMMSHIARAVELMDSTHELAFVPQLFPGTDVLQSSMSHASDAYPALLVDNPRTCYDDPSGYDSYLSSIAESITLVQPASLCSPDFRGVLFPSELESTSDHTNPPQSRLLDELLDQLRARKVDAILCVGQDTDAEVEYARRMYRIVAAYLSIGVPTCAGTNLCWNVGSVGMHAMSCRGENKHPLITTTVMSYFQAFLHEQRILETIGDLWSREPIRLYALTNADDSPCKIENIWMGMAAFYGLASHQQRALFRPFAHGLIFESMRQALQTKTKNHPNATSELLGELVSTLSVGTGLGTTDYNALDDATDANVASVLWTRDLDEARMCVDDRCRTTFDALRAILRDSPSVAKTATFLGELRRLTAIQCPSGVRTSITPDEVDALLLRLLGATQTRDQKLPYWCGVEQLRAVCDGLDYLATTDAPKFGYVPPDVCDRLVRHVSTERLATLYDSADAFVCQLLYLLCCGGNNRTIRDTPAPTTLDELVRLLPRPASAASVESVRMQGLARNLATWARVHWSSDEIVGLYTAIGGHYSSGELVGLAHELAVQFHAPALFGTVLRLVALPDLEPETAIRHRVDAHLREPLYVEVAGTVQADIQMRLEKGQSAHPSIGSRRFNRLLGGLVRAVLSILGRPLQSGTITFEQYMEAKKANPTHEVFKKGGGYYLKHFQSISFCVTDGSSDVFIDAIGEVLERHGHTERNRRIFLWGVTELCLLSRPDCPMRALALSHIRQSRDHTRTILSKFPHLERKKQEHYRLVVAHWSGILPDPVDDDEAGEDDDDAP